MARHLSPERRQLKAQAIVLRKMGWSQQKIADQIGVPRTTVTDWFDDNTTNIPVKRYRSDDKTKRVISVKPQFLSWRGKVEDFASESKISFDLIIADPPYILALPAVPPTGGGGRTNGRRMVIGSATGATQIR